MDHASNATCPKCVHSFKSGLPERRSRRAEAADDGESQLPAWISPWGVSALCLATLALFAAPLFGSRILSSSLAVLGLAAIGAGLLATAGNRLPRDRTWFCVSAGANLLTLGLIFFAGGWLNTFWGMDAPIPKGDPNLLVALVNNQANVQGRTLKPDDRIDAATEAILQNDVFFRIMSVQPGTVSERGDKSFLLINFRMAGRGNDQPILIEGFGTGKHQPKMVDEAGHAYPFVEMRKRKMPAGGIVFIRPAASETADLISGKFLDYQLVFELPPPNFPPLHLDLPTSAWGRQGICKFRITEFFDPIVPPPVESK